jgi:Actinobacteria/chloroflexi VLRF1 release factor
MANGQSAASRWLDVSPDRIAGWIGAFAGRHGGASSESDGGIVTLRAADGAVAECHPPFPPLPAGSGGSGPELAAHATADRLVGVFLVRLGGYAAGVFDGSDARLVASKVGSRLVHGRNAAGGTSQHRFARRREKQVSEALAAAADCAVRVFGPYGARLDAVVLGGDKRAMAEVREDVRLRPFFALAADRFLTVPDPRLKVLQGTPAAFRAIRIRFTEPAR